MDRTINLVNGQATLSDTGQIKLGGTDGNTVSFKVGRGFAAGAEVSEISLYFWQPSGNHQGASVGTWTRSNPSTEPFGYLNVSTNGASIDVSDTNDETAEYDYCFTVTVNDGSNHTTVDPELRVLKKHT